MKWPWSKPEQRAETSSYTDEIVRAITSRVSGVAIRKPEATAAGTGGMRGSHRSSVCYG